MRLVPSRQGTHLPQALVLSELQEEARQVDHAGLVIDDDHAARAHDRACLGEALVVDGSVKKACRDAAARGAAELDGLELATVLHAAADVEDQVAQGRAHRYFSQTTVDALPASEKALVPRLVSTPSAE